MKFGELIVSIYHVSWGLRLFCCISRHRRGEPCGSGESPRTLPPAVSQCTPRISSMCFNHGQSAEADYWAVCSLPFLTGLIHVVLSRPNRAAERERRKGNLSGGVTGELSVWRSCIACPFNISKFGYMHLTETTKNPVIKKPKLNFVRLFYYM